jgi:PTS system nitrogen regulatory IIA component
VAVVLDAQACTRDDVLHSAAARGAAAVPGLDADAVFRALARREQAASTALGAGVAIPHARVDAIERPYTFFLRTRLAIDFGAPDGKPVDRFVVILVPRDGDADEHLEMLAMLTQRIGDAAFRRRLGDARTDEDVRRAFTLAPAS